MRTAFLLLALWFGLPQGPAPLHFDAASVKPAESGGPPGDVPRNMDPSPGHFAMRNVAFRFALEWAYDLKDYEISGPDWIKGDERYDIVANAPSGATPASEDAMRQMLQTLLIERFHMKLHWETRNLPAYVLTLGKGTPRLNPAQPGRPPALVGQSHGVLFQNQPISRLTFLLTRRLDRPTLDLTGLKGNYDYTLDISGLPGGDTEGPSIFSAISDDLGLKLEARTMPIKTLVVDSLNKMPDAN